MADGVKYIKISKIDKNGIDKTIILQSLTELTIPYSTGNVKYDILDIVEKPTYFLYRVDNPNIEWADRATLEYDFTGSLSGDNFITTTSKTIPIVSTTNDPLNFYNESTQQCILKTYPQKSLHFIVTGSYDLSTTSFFPFIQIYSVNPTTLAKTVIASGLGITGVGQTLNIRGSYTPTIPGEEFIFQINGDSLNPVDYTFYSSSFIITSSVASGPSVNTIPEPYFSSDFNRALDCQPTLNNAVNARLSSLHQDIDYGSGVMVPTNFDLLISGSAFKAAVQDSNYTLKRHTNPRYEGSRTTSQKLNEWSVGDIGTFGKLPSVESNKVFAAYCDWIGGAPPERMDTSAAHVLYLIKDDGSVVSPSTSEFSLETVQGTFISNENTRIKWDFPGTEVRKIIKGGSDLKVILYNQSGHPQANNLSFTGSITLTDKGNPFGLIGDYQATLNKSAQQTISSPSTWTAITYPNIFSSGSDLSSGDVSFNFNGYRINADLITDGLDITFKTTVVFYNSNSSPRGGNAIRLFNVTTGQQVGNEVYLNGDGFIAGTSTGVATLNITVPNIQLTSGDVYRIEGITSANFISVPFPAQLIIEQTPAPTATLSTNGLFQRVPSAYTSSYNGVFISSSFFTSVYGTNVYQKDISGSGFNSIVLPLSFQPGDEFRFEGDENKVFMVEKVEQGIFPFSPVTGSIMVYFNKEVTPNTSSLNINEFAIRRYVPDSSLILIEGYKPLGSVGPYILTPEFISPELSSNLDRYIADLTEKGLL